MKHENSAEVQLTFFVLRFASRLEGDRVGIASFALGPDRNKIGMVMRRSLCVMMRMGSE